jgi:hypothetical protein
MKFDILTGQPVVTATLDARTAIDVRTKRLDLEDTLRKVLADNDLPIERHEDGHRYVRGLSCGVEACGETWNTLSNHPAMRYVTPGGDPSYPGNPRYLSCTVCVGPAVRNSGLFLHLHPTNRAKHLDDFSCTKLHDRDFTAVRCDGKAVVTDLSFRQTAQMVAVNQPDLGSDFGATLIRACALDVAEHALQHKDFPHDAFVNVPLTSELWPKAAWHSQPMTTTDSEGIREHAKRQRREAAKSVEAEVAAFRAELKARQRA